MQTKHQNLIAYTSFGVAFGFCFPVIAILADLMLFKGIAFSWANVGKVHGLNPLHFIIDTAPFFLGLAFSFAGYKQDKLSRINHNLRRTFEELLQQKEEILTQRDLLGEKNTEIERKSYDLNSSIQYAQTIQRAILPDLKLMQKYIPELFVFYKPRDVLSGDFYYFNKKNGKLFLGVADCTGHGIPAAFMSLVGYQHLNNIISQQGIIEPHTILACLHEGIYSTLRQDQTRNSDGMDIGLCVIDTEERKIDFAGSKISLYYVHEKELVRVKADRIPIGGTQYYATTFQTQTIPLLPTEPMMFYLFSDGYQDQFGGENNTKFLSSRLKELLLQIYHHTPLEQRKILMLTIENWIGAGKNDQTDDMLVLGFRL